MEKNPWKWQLVKLVSDDDDMVGTIMFDSDDDNDSEKR